MATKHIGFLVLPDFSMMALSSATEPLRAANRQAGVAHYAWHLLSVDGEQVASSSGFRLLPEASLQAAGALDMVFVVASLGVTSYRNRQVFDWLRRFATTGRPLGAISTASFILARAGLLDGYQCTIHWESLREFAEAFPRTRPSREIYVRDRDRLTCAGGTAALDLMLDLIASEHGAKLAAMVADNFLHARIRPAGESQRMAIHWRYGINDPRIVKAIALMEQHVEDALAIEQLAGLVGVSPRQFERLFQTALGRGPARFYQDLRLEEARRLVIESTESLSAIALCCGFASVSHLGRAFRTAYGRTPGEERRRSRPSPA